MQIFFKIFILSRVAKFINPYGNLEINYYF